MDTLEMPASVDEVLREVSKLKTIVTEAVDDGVRSALKAVKKGRHAAEDALQDTEHAVKQNPFEAVGIAFAAGLVLGGFAAWASMRRR